VFTDGSLISQENGATTGWLVLDRGNIAFATTFVCHGLNISISKGSQTEAFTFILKPPLHYHSSLNTSSLDPATQSTSRSASPPPHPSPLRLSTRRSPNTLNDRNVLDDRPETFQGKCLESSSASCSMTLPAQTLFPPSLRQPHLIPQPPGSMRSILSSSSSRYRCRLKN